MASASNLVAAAAMLAPALEAQAWAHSTEIELIDGCYYQGHKYDGHRLQEEATRVDSLQACQKLCQQDDACRFFTYFAQTEDCYKLGKDAVYDNKGAEGASCGPKVCPSIPSGCTETPAAGFPASTPDETEKLFPSHRQPHSLECWPRNENDGMYDSCRTKTVLEDSAFGWPAACMGLVARSGPDKKDYDLGIPEGESCESLCTKTPECSMWVVVNDTAQACWHGLGNNCYQRASDTFPGVVRAQRIMHGEVRVLANLTRVQVWGLTKAFDSNYFMRQQPDAVDACRNHCYSNIECQYWQYSSITGCWTEEPGAKGENAVEYPLTTHAATDDSHMAKFIIAGEYIQHLCPGAQHIPAKFSAAFIPQSTRFAPPPEVDIYGVLRAQHPDIHPAPPVRDQTYGNQAYYHEAAQAVHGVIDKAKTVEAEVLYAVGDGDAAQASEKSNKPSLQSVLEVAVCGSGVLALMAAICLAFRRPRRRHHHALLQGEAAEAGMSDSPTASEP